jgi:lipopolysaccharide export system permease protein
VIDRYLLRLMLRWQAMIVAIVLALLSLEMLPRLLAELNRSDGGAALVVRMLASLLPEYVAVALPIAVFLASALTFRHLALQNEIDALAATGLSDWRLLRWPLLVGMASALLLFGIRGYLEPAGERNLDGIAVAIADGDYGVGLQPGIVHRLGNATLYFETSAPRGGEVTNIFVQRGPLTVSAAAARLAWSGKGELLISFHQGDTLSPGDHGRRRLLGFQRFDLAIPAASRPPPPEHRSPRQQLDRYPLTTLMTLARIAAGKPLAVTAAAAIWERVSAASLCLLLPLFAPFLAIPPKRSRSAIGIGLGLLLIILFWRLSALIEDTWPQHMPLADMLLLTVYALSGAALLITRQSSGIPIVILSPWQDREVEH